MSSRRVQKVAEAIREVVSMAIIANLKDPRIRNVTVTRVEVAADLRQAKVHVSIMGDETQQRLSLAGLKSAAGFLQSKVAADIDTRYTPKLEFVLDMGVKKSIEIARILREVLPEQSPSDGGAASAAADVPGDDSDFTDDETELADQEYETIDPSADGVDGDLTDDDPVDDRQVDDGQVDDGEADDAQANDSTSPPRHPRD